MSGQSSPTSGSLPWQQVGLQCGAVKKMHSKRFDIECILKMYQVTSTKDGAIILRMSMFFLINISKYEYETNKEIGNEKPSNA